MTFSPFSVWMEQSGSKMPAYVAVKVLANEKRNRWLSGPTGILRTIPNRCSDDSLHATIIYSRKPTNKPDIRAERLYSGDVTDVTTFNQRNGKKCLVLKFNSLELRIRHHQLMSELSASYDFPDYVPHITLSYDFHEESNRQLLNDIKQQVINQPIWFGDEYYEPLTEL